MVEPIEGEWPEAPEYPPADNFDVQTLSYAVHQALKELGTLSEKGALSTKREPGWLGKELIALMETLAGETGWTVGMILQFLMPFLKALVVGVCQVLRPGMEALGLLTGAYVTEVAGHGLEKSPAGLPVPGGPARDATSLVFDRIMAPLLGLLTPSNPAKVGSGEDNAQHILGTIISLHLSTWMVNIISNLTGFGALKWINSFDDAITSGISARGFSRMATRPYLDKFVVTPATRDLNLRYPLQVGSVAALIKRYIRGNITAEELKRMLRGMGYDDAVVEDLLLDTAKFLPMDAVLWLVNTGQWTDAEGAEYLEHQGYPKGYSRLALYNEQQAPVRSQMLSLANSLVSAFIDRRIDNETLRYLLKQAGFADHEVDAFSMRGAILQELPKPLTQAQVIALYNAGIWDLTRVRQFLEEEGYAPDDADALELMYFCKKEEREQRALEIKNRRRVALEARLGYEEEAHAAYLAELEALGGPTS